MKRKRDLTISRPKLKDMKARGESMFSIPIDEIPSVLLGNSTDSDLIVGYKLLGNEQLLWV